MAKSTSRTGRLVGVAIVVIIGLWAGWNFVGVTPDEGIVDESPPPAPPPTPEPDLPGEPFAASGTLGAMPGAPNLPVNLWDNPDRSAGVVRVAGQLSPGESVVITRRYRHAEEDRFYYRVESGELVGWVPETLVDVSR